MTTVLICLTWSAMLCFLHIAAQVVMPRIENPGVPYDPNRETKRELGPKSARAERALRNFLETYPMFIALAAVVSLAGVTGSLVGWGAILYVVGRAIYLPLYILGIAPLRSAFWTLSFVGMAMMFVAAVSA